MPNTKKSTKTGRFIKHAKYVKKVCENCHKEFEIKASSLKYGRGKCCSRKCVDENKKRTYAGENNPSYGRKQSLEERQKRSHSMKSAYKRDPSIKDRQRNGIKKYVEKTGYYPGSDPKSIEKKKQTNLKKYGVEWVGANIPELKRRAEETCLKRYGKSSIQMMQEALLSTIETKPEIIFREYLETLNINFIPQYKLVVGETYRYFDFMLTDLNILVEIDGDFWHANPNIYDLSNLHEVQIQTLRNDDFKNKMIEHTDFDLIRFWASEVMEEGFLDKIKEVICQRKK